MSGFKFDPSQPGLRKTLREYEELARARNGVWRWDGLAGGEREAER